MILFGTSRTLCQKHLRTRDAMPIPGLGDPWKGSWRRPRFALRYTLLCFDQLNALKLLLHVARQLALLYAMNWFV